MFKKNLAKRLATALMLGTLTLGLAACGGKSEATTTAKAETTAAAATTEAAATTAAAETTAAETTTAETTAAETTAAETTAAAGGEYVKPENGLYVESNAGRGQMTVTDEGDSFCIEVNWSGSAAESARWLFHGTFDESGVLTYSDCYKEHHVFDEDGNETVETEYTDGSGKLTYSNGSFTWVDDQENIAEGCTFIKQ